MISDVKTDYQLSSNYISVQKGGLVKIINLPSFIFLIMLCLLSGPVMRIFQYSVPWSTQATRYIVKGINKIGPKEGQNKKKDQE